MTNEKVVYEVAEWLLIVGGLNWGLSQFFGFNLVTVLVGSIPIVAQIIYGAIAASALWLAYFKLKK